MSLRVIRLRADPCRFPVEVLIGDAEAAQKWIERAYHRLAEFSEDADGITFDIPDLDGAHHFVIWLESFDWRISHQGRAVHELLHAVKDICEHAGIEDEEFEAYSMDSLVCQLWSKLRPKKHKRKP